MMDLAPSGPTPVVLVTGGVSEAPPDAVLLHLGVTLAGRRARTLLVQTAELPGVPLPAGNAPLPYSVGSHLWRVSCPSVVAAAAAPTAWVPDFSAVLVGGDDARWVAPWGEVATHVLLVLTPSPDGASSAWETLLALPSGLPVGCMVTTHGLPGREAFERLCTFADRSGRRAVQWLGPVPHERGDWWRAYRRLTQRVSDVRDE